VTSLAGEHATHPVYDAQHLPTSGWRWYRPRMAKRMAQIGGPCTIHTAAGPMTFPPGWRGYLVVGPDGNPMPIPDGTHRVAYEPLGDPE
jgi:hypothetical protein